MNYEIKSLSAGSIFRNAARVFLVIGLVVAIYSFFIHPNPDLRVADLKSKLIATGFFTLVYGLMLSTLFMVASMLYNLWTPEFQLKSFFLKALWPFGIAGIFLGLASNFLTLNDHGFILRLLGSLLYAAIFAPVMAIVTAGLTALFTMIFGPCKGASIRLEERND